jgi:hypothetical protein
MTRAEIEARLAELEPLEDEAAALQAQLDLSYLIAEGFVVEEDGRLYPVTDEPLYLEDKR